jgi:hypothetical protein
MQYFFYEDSVKMMDIIFLIIFLLFTFINLFLILIISNHLYLIFYEVYLFC